MQTQMTIEPTDVIEALNAKLAAEVQRNIMLEAAVAKLRRELAEKDKPEPAE